MSNVVILTGSVRKGRVADTILAHVQNELANYPHLSVTLADVKELQLPFFDSEIIPSDERYEITHPGAKRLSQLVSEADTVLILSPEYNHSVPAALKNAIDWLYTEWKGKKIAFIGYGWVGGARSINHLHGVFENLGVELLEPEANLRFKKEIELDGTILHDDAHAAIKSVLDVL